ncbi:isopentenyl-diphosphate delta-isomerase, type I [Natrialba magadii ATCC 43099]|uniref:Isopentenyl-diphosphate Delta-isomerase n=1 Tax=Natrialba magadii (strain ATCC 43099 / DSM 3394 / CCM 3739 / CIP 104546 / IAM 13178 / JCM 8861 / NBRC 102185 / NCIMB 2190 / MS3) TaxID=547559 RepID=D3SZM2_NATMM|nr:NUDIX domain-containing protein [Natrialba magadii]ADD06282.1 isopentenyl-diphosphate delta-isomerase, type I [Natrialba magadii ATCC 43099]ELY31282.1 isopentenyl-diphosphate delta-isomerase [Natrialba magadii ATCC 43099]
MSTPGAPAEDHEHDDTDQEHEHEHEPEHKNARQNVIAVDEDDTALESVNRLEAHTGEGIRHRAFTALVFDEDDNVLLAQRAPEKRLWGTYWDGTVASHPVEGQRQTEATRQRLEEELGIMPDQYDDLRVTDRFEYKRYFENAGVEHEVCAVLKLTLADVTLDPNEEEVAGLLWVPYKRLADNPEWYRQLRLCPWFEIAMRRDVQTDVDAQTKAGLE